MATIIRKFCVERRKYRRLYIPVIFLLFLLIDISMVSLTALNSNFQSTMNQPESHAWYTLMDSYLMAKLIFTPILLAVVISRVVDMENDGDMWKMLKTSGWSMEEIFDIKFFSIFARYIIFQVLEWLIFINIGKKVGIIMQLPIERFTIILISIIAISFFIMTIHYYLALKYENQLIGLAFGVVGSLVGIIGAFLPFSISKLVPYSYYAHLITLKHVKVGEGQFIANIVPIRLYPFVISLLLGVFVFLWSRRKIKVLEL